MRRALDLQEHAGLDAFEGADAGDGDRIVGAEALELHLLLQTIARHIGLHLLDHRVDRLLDLLLRWRRTTSVKTVSRMIIGGSAGLRMMIALPLSAPPTVSMPRAVVSVNSSILARVPGPADLEAIDATISA